MKREKLEVECDYCERKGVIGEDIEIRHSKFVCKDIKACDAREAKLNPEPYEQGDQS